MKTTLETNAFRCMNYRDTVWIQNNTNTFILWKIVKISHSNGTKSVHHLCVWRKVREKSMNPNKKWKKLTNQKKLTNIKKLTYITKKWASEKKWTEKVNIINNAEIEQNKHNFKKMPDIRWNKQISEKTTRLTHLHLKTVKL